MISLKMKYYELYGVHPLATIDVLDFSGVAMNVAYNMGKRVEKHMYVVNWYEKDS